MPKVQTLFSAAMDGFEFVNFFEIKLPVKFALPLAGEIDLNKVVFGLCGGMCYAALDYFYAKQKPPQFAAPQELPLPLTVYLCERQIASLSLPALVKIIEWMAQGDDVLAARMLRSELPKLRRALDKGSPSVVCLIRAEPGASLTQNHQVVVTGYDLEAVPGSVVLSLYDPNHPLDAPTLTLGLAKDGFSIRQSSGEPLRGFFVMPYARSRALPALPAPAGAPSFDIAAAEEVVSPPPFLLRWPVDSRQVNQFFGENPQFYKPFGLAGHEGVDFYAPSGARVYAAFDGVVSEAKYRGAYGNQVRIRHEHNGVQFTTVYAHLHKWLVMPNQALRAGDLVGLADNTGNSTGSHLHFTLFVDGQKTKGYYDGIVNPWDYFEGNQPPPPPVESGVVVYTTQEVNLRALPTTDSDILTLLAAGEALPVFGAAEDVKQKIGQQGQWLNVKTAAGQTGYVAAWLTENQDLQAFPPSGLIVYPFDDLPLRAGPALGLAQVGLAGPATPLNVLGSAELALTRLGVKDQWIQALAPNGARGFVPAWLVRVTGDIPPLAGAAVTPSVFLNLRAAPNTAADVMAIAAPGDALKLVGDRASALAKVGQTDQWLNVKAPNGVVGWVAAWYVSLLSAPVDGETGGQPQPPPPAGAVYPTAEAGINLRGSPDVDAMRIAGAVKNEPLTLLDGDLAAAQGKLGQPGQWLYVEKANGQRGWAAAWYLSAAPS